MGVGRSRYPAAVYFGHQLNVRRGMARRTSAPHAWQR